MSCCYKNTLLIGAINLKLDAEAGLFEIGIIGSYSEVLWKLKLAIVKANYCYCGC